MVKEDIQFTNGKSKLERGYGNGNPKISVKIKGVQKRSKAIYRGDDRLGEFLGPLITEFLNSNEVKDKIIQYYIENPKKEWE